MTSLARSRSLLRLGALALTVGVLLAACGDDAAPATSTLPASVPAESPVSSPVSSEPVAIVGVHEGVEFYPACGNEILDHLGVTWFSIVAAGGVPVDPALQPQVDEVFSSEREPSPVAGKRGLVRVAAPGPGDDIGTLVVWADGVARWVSDSGDLDQWLVADEIQYMWVC